MSSAMQSLHVYGDWKCQRKSLISLPNKPRQLGTAKFEMSAGDALRLEKLLVLKVLERLVWKLKIKTWSLSPKITCKDHCWRSSRSLWNAILKLKDLFWSAITLRAIILGNYLEQYFEAVQIWSKLSFNGIQLPKAAFSFGQQARSPSNWMLRLVLAKSNEGVLWIYSVRTTSCSSAEPLDLRL